MGFSLNPLHDFGSVLHSGEEIIGSGAKDFKDAMKDAAKAVTHVSPSQIGHATLDIVGMVPVVGTVANLANAGWYAAQGDWTDAAWSAAAAVPIEGDALDALKLGKDAAEMGEDAGKAERIVKGGEEATAAAGKGGEDVAKGELGATSAEAAKGAKPQRVIDNQAAQDKLISNQQRQLKEAIEQRGARGKGEILDQQGKDVEALSHDTLKQIKGAEVEPNVRIAKGEGSVIDNVVERGGRTVYVENKLTIAEPNDRMINQLTNATKAAKPGDAVILNVAREPTPGEIANLRKALGDDVFNKIKIVNKQTDLFDTVTAALR